MVLDYQYLKRNKSFNHLDSTSPYIVLNAKHFDSFEDRALFSYNIEVLNCINAVQWVNQITKNINANFTIESGILYEAISHIFSLTPFSDEQLITYFETQQALEYFDNAVQKIKNFNFDINLPYEVDFILLGIDYEAYSNLNANERAELHDQYGAISFEVRNKSRTIQNFIRRAKELVIMEND